MRNRVEAMSIDSLIKDRSEMIKTHKDNIKRMQKRIYELEEKLKNQDMQLACERMDSNRFLAGQEDGVRGAVMRWNQALTEPYPKSGVMSPILEKPYRQTEELRKRIDELEAEVKMLTVEVNADVFGGDI